MVDRLRLYGFGYDNYGVYARRDGVWNKTDYETDGRYAVIDYSDGFEGYAIIRTGDYSEYIYIGIGVAAAVAVPGFIIHKKKKK